MQGALALEFPRAGLVADAALGRHHAVLGHVMEEPLRALGMRLAGLGMEQADETFGLQEEIKVVDPRLLYQLADDSHR